VVLQEVRKVVFTHRPMCMLQVFEFFQKRIAMQYPLVEDTDTNPFTLTRDAHEAFLKSRCDTVIGRDSVVQQARERFICGYR